MRDILDEAIGAPPASTVDVDRVVAAGRRRTRLRRLAMVSPAVPAVAAVAVALAALGGSPTGGPSGPQPGMALPGSPGEAPVYADETPEQTRQRLAAALAAGLAAAGPGISLSDGPTGQAGVTVSVNDDLGRYESDTVLTTATGESELFFVSWPGGDQPEYQMPTSLPTDQPVPTSWIDSCVQVPDNEENTPEGYSLVTECDESVGAEGQVIVVLTKTCVDCPGQPILRRDAYVTWTNARVLVSIENSLKRDDPPATTPTAELVLTKGQLVTIASDPELTVAA
jgi:hypothetical protein